MYEHTSLRDKRRIVAVARSHDEFCDWVLKSMIEQSGMTKNEFYGMTETTAKKLQCTFLKNGLDKPAGQGHAEAAMPSPPSA